MLGLILQTQKSGGKEEKRRTYTILASFKINDLKGGEKKSEYFCVILGFAHTRNINKNIFGIGALFLIATDSKKRQTFYNFVITLGCN